MNRFKFYNSTIVKDHPEVDMLHNTLSSFELNHQYGFYRIADEDFMFPDLISFKVYGTERYWWLICLVNNIQDPFTELIVGTLLKIPNMLDIQEFYRKFRAR